MEWTCGRISTGALGSSGSKALLLAPSSALLFIIDAVSTIRSFSICSELQSVVYTVQTQRNGRSSQPYLGRNIIRQLPPQLSTWSMTLISYRPANKTMLLCSSSHARIFDMPAQLPPPTHKSNIALPLPACQLCMHESTLQCEQLHANPFTGCSSLERKGKEWSAAFPCQRPIFLHVVSNTLLPPGKVVVAPALPPWAWSDDGSFSLL